MEKEMQEKILEAAKKQILGAIDKVYDLENSLVLNKQSDKSSKALTLLMDAQKTINSINL